MSKEELLLQYWRKLPPESQEEVLKLAQSLKPQSEFIPQTPLAQKLWEIRQRAIANGMNLLTEEELEQELAERRGGYREP
ncbi:hypothetical protein Q2T42_15075 [Leptolyngbya boryana CZ1]|uniref:Uncharacterized protein n=1 Tax=Leptolyngbya boryana CZ1 TaxID=3060204 RepID=A0AA96X2P6_LEPBY|nr:MULTISPECIES: hypothetical protein [Leptolyngbya]MBD1857680.1 hypothetical protein [Leptolyngbya sp. FACHB-1624]WNZ49143.1 hypothetical protein Q2T42_15075 [Leptolyngbya boryana CZ1]